MIYQRLLPKANIDIIHFWNQLSFEKLRTTFWTKFGIQYAPLQQSYKLNCFCLKVIPVPDHSKEYQCLIPTPKILISVPVTKYRECDFSFLFPSPYKPGGRGAMCPSWLPYSTDSYLHILVFVFVSCVSQFAKFCKLWARQRRQVFLCVTICKILQIVDQTTTTRFPFF